MRKAWLIVLTCTAFSAFAQGNGDELARRQAVREYFASRGEDKLVEALVAELSHTYIANLQKSHPEISSQRMKELQDKIQANMMDTKEDYLRHEEDILSANLSLDELHAATAFYNSPAGKKLAATAPGLVSEVGKSQLAWATAAIKKATDDLNSAAKAGK
jgi:hypothetical protein